MFFVKHEKFLLFSIILHLTTLCYILIKFSIFLLCNVLTCNVNCGII
nr:MAG TPA: hypothetical protein [Bacteriophage sp.]